MEKDMGTSTFFSVFQLMKFMQYQSMKRMEKTGRTCRHYTAIHDCCVTEDGRKRICDTKTG